MDPQVVVSEERFWNRKNILGFLAVGILLLAIPFGIKLLEQTTFLKSRAGGGGVTFAGDNIVDCPSYSGPCAKDSKVTIQFTSPFGPPAGSTATPSATPVATSTPIATPTVAPTAVPPTSTPVPTRGLITPSALRVTLTGPDIGMVGQNLSFTASATHNTGNLVRIDVYAAKTTDQNSTTKPSWCPSENYKTAYGPWCLMGTASFNATGIYSLPVSFTPTEAGDYYMAANIKALDGSMCGSNPWGNPAGWADCKPSGFKQITVSGAQQSFFNRIKGIFASKIIKTVYADNQTGPYNPNNHIVFGRVYKNGRFVDGRSDTSLKIHYSKTDNKGTWPVIAEWAGTQSSGDDSGAPEYHVYTDTSVSQSGSIKITLDPPSGYSCAWDVTYVANNATDWSDKISGTGCSPTVSLKPRENPWRTVMTWYLSNSSTPSGPANTFSSYYCSDFDAAGKLISECTSYGINSDGNNKAAWCGCAKKCAGKTNVYNKPINAWTQTNYPQCVSIWDQVTVPSNPNFTPTPNSSVLRVNLTGSGSGAIGQALNFTAEAGASAGDLVRVEVYAAKTTDQNSTTKPSWCSSASYKSAYGPWCPLGVATFDATGSYSLPVSFTTTEAGDYYIAANIKTTANSWCGSNPWGNPAGWADCRPSGFKQISVSGSNPTSTTTPAPSETPVPTTHTAKFRMSVTPFTKDAVTPVWGPYTAEEMDYDFGNVQAGEEKVLYVQYMDDSPTPVVSDVFSSKIKFITPDPQVDNISCGYDPSGSGTQVVISGIDLGPQGNYGSVNFGGKTLKINSWSNDISSDTSTSSAYLIPASTSDSVLGISSSRSRIVGKINEKIQPATTVPLVLTLDDGRVFGENNNLTCTIDTTTAAFVAKTQCRPGGDFSNSNVKVTITELASGAKPVFNQSLSLDANGKPPTEFQPSLEKGKKYKVVIKAPKTLARKLEFTAEDGSNILNEFSLPIGDIAPLGNPDGKVNAVDKSELVREWNTVSDTSRAADFNMDGRVNSLDWSCMRNNFNQEDQQ